MAATRCRCSRATWCGSSSATSSRQAGATASLAVAAWAMRERSHMARHVVSADTHPPNPCRRPCPQLCRARPWTRRCTTRCSWCPTRTATLASPSSTASGGPGRRQGTIIARVQNARTTPRVHSRRATPQGPQAAPASSSMHGSLRGGGNACHRPGPRPRTGSRCVSSRPTPPPWACPRWEPNPAGRACRAVACRAHRALTPLPYLCPVPSMQRVLLTRMDVVNAGQRRPSQAPLT